MRIRRAWAMVMAIIMSVSLTLGNTIAYLQDEDYAVNVMTVGNVDIKLVEKERVEQSELNTNADNLRDFRDDNPLLPAVYPETGVAMSGAEQQFPTGGSAALWADTTKNVVDKMVFVENVGRSDAYIRVWFAFEQGSMTEEDFNRYVLLNKDTQHWNWEDVAYNVAIDDNVYAIKAATYNGGADVHVGGILPKGETTRPSLLQLLIDKTADNRELQAIDGNSDGMYNVLVVSQGTQIMGFADAEQALNISFNNGQISTQVPVEVIQTWFGGMVNEDAGEEEEEIDLTNYDKADNVQQLQDFIQQLNDEPVDDNNPDQLPQAFVHVRENMELEALNLESGELNLYIEAGKTLKLGEADVSGWNLLSTAKAEGDGYIHVGKRAKVNVTGKGDIVSHADAVFNLAGGKLTINTKGNIICNTEEGSIFLVEGQYGGGQSVSTATIKKGNFEADYLSYGGNLTVNIEGGTFSMTRESLKEDVLTSQDEVESGWYDSALVYNITGGTFAGDGEEPTATPTAKPTATPTAEPTPAPTPALPSTITSEADLQAVVAALNNGTVSDRQVSLGSNVTLTENLTLQEGELDIDLNGYNLTSNQYIQVYEGSSLSIEGEGDVTGTFFKLFSMYGGDLRLDVDGIVTCYDDIEMGTIFYADNSSYSETNTAEAQITILDGQYEIIEETGALTYGGHMNIVIEGGTFNFPESKLESEAGYSNWLVTMGDFETAIRFDVNGGTFAAEPTPEPTPALPSTINSVADMQAVLDAASENDTELYEVKLGADITMPSCMWVSGQVEIDLNGYNLHVTANPDEYDDAAIYIYSAGDLTLKGEGNVYGTSRYETVIIFGGKLTVDITGNFKAITNSEIINFWDEGEVELKNGNFSAMNLDDEQKGLAYFGMYGTQKLTISGGTYAWRKSAIETLDDEPSDGAELLLSITGGTFAAEPTPAPTPALPSTITSEADLQAVVAALNNGTVSDRQVSLGSNVTLTENLTLQDGELDIDLNGYNLTSNQYIQVYEGSSLSIEGEGDVTGTFDVLFSMYGGNLQLDVNGIVTCFDGMEMGTIFSGDNSIYSETNTAEAQITILDGQYEIIEETGALTYGGHMNIVIEGGTFNFPESKLESEAGYSNWLVTMGDYETAIRFDVNGGTFAEESTPELPDTVSTAEELQALLTALEEGAAESHEVKLGADIDMGGTLDINNSILTIDLNGHTLKAYGDWEMMSSAICLRNANLKIEGTGNVIGYNAETFSLWNNSSLTVDVNGNVENHWTYENQMAGKFFIYDYDCKSPVVLNNGNFVADDDLDAFMMCETNWGPDYDYLTKLTINGGTYGWTESFIREGCEEGKVTFVKNGGTFVTEVEVADEDDMAAAFAALENGGELEAKLVEDVKLTSSKTLEGGKLTLNLNGHTITTDDYAITDSCSLEVSGGDLTVKGNGNLTWTCDSAVFVGTKGSITVNIDGDVSSNGFIRDTDMETGEPFEIPNGKIFRYVGEDAHITVNSGTYSNNTEFGMVDAYGCTGENSLTLNGGTFLYSEEELEEQCQSVTYKNNGAEFIETVSSFSELYSAMYASQDGVTTTVKLMNDIVVNDDLVFDAGNMTIDLNGHDIVCEMTNPEETYAGSFYVEGGNLTLQGEGNLRWNNLDGIFAVRGGELTVKVSGNVTNNGQYNGQAVGVIFKFIGSGTYVTMHSGHYAASKQIVDASLAKSTNNELHVMYARVDATHGEMESWCGDNVYFENWYGDLEYDEEW